MAPPKVLSRLATSLEPRCPRLVGRGRRAADQALEWRDSWRHRHHPDPGVPWTARYRRHQRELIERALADPGLLRDFEQGHELPSGYGAGLDERVVEYPWTLAHRPSGRVLDAGSTLNWPHVLGRFLPAIDQLQIATLEPGRPALADPAVSYVHTDLRELPFRDDWFDAITCISTLEHIGMDNSRWGVDGAETSVADDDRERAIAELRRVAKPGGRVLLTVPYGVPERRSWFDQFDEAGLQRLIDAFGPERTSLTVYRYCDGGWRLSDPRDAADARYRDERAQTEPPPADVAAAGAVACVELRLPAQG